MNELKSARLTIYEQCIGWNTPVGAFPCVIFNAVETAMPFPSMVTATGMLIRSKRGYLLHHLLVDDEARGQGYATEIVQFYEERFGNLDAAWASEAGAAFAERYIARVGPRPHWRIGVSPEVAAIYEGIPAERAGVPAEAGQ